MITFLRTLFNKLMGREQGPQTSPPLSTLEKTFNTTIILGQVVNYYRTFILDDESVELQSADSALCIRLYRGGLRYEDLLAGKRTRYVRVRVDGKFFAYPYDIVSAKHESPAWYHGLFTELVLAHVALMHPEEGKLLALENFDPRRWSLEDFVAPE